MQTRGAGFWTVVTLVILAAAWGAWTASAPVVRHPSIIVDVSRG